MNKLTQFELKELLSYSYEAGIFTWKINSGRNAIKGREAGTVRKDGYVVIIIKGKSYLAHRLAWVYMTGEWPKNEIDHIDKNKQNNAFYNLRDVIKADNSKNLPLRHDNNSGVTGVLWHKKNGKWVSQVRVDRKNIYLGSFVDFFEACCTRLSANNKYGFYKNHGQPTTQERG